MNHFLIKFTNGCSVVSVSAPQQETSQKDRVHSDLQVLEQVSNLVPMVFPCTNM